MKLLTDSHVPLAVASQLRRKGIDVVGLADWRDGRFRNATDEQILVAAAEEDRVLLTYDCRTFPDFLIRIHTDGRHHAGVILVDEQTIAPHDVGGLVRALIRIVQREELGTWRDQVRYLRPG